MTMHLEKRLDKQVELQRAKKRWAAFLLFIFVLMWGLLAVEWYFAQQMIDVRAHVSWDHLLDMVVFQAFMWLVFVQRQMVGVVLFIAFISGYSYLSFQQEHFPMNEGLLLQLVRMIN